MAGTSVGVGVVGAGTISTEYLTTFAGAPDLHVVAIADLDPPRAAAATDLAPGARATTTEDLLGDDAVEVVVNLTVPAVHTRVTRAAIAAGKDVWSEKPLALASEDGRALVEEAARAGVRVGCAPDTVLGTAVQTARRAIDDGLLGRPVAATALMQSPGPEPWHHQPDFYYLPGGGPVFDMAPYYLSALVHLLGPVTQVVAAASRSRDERMIGSGPRTGERVPVEVDTHVAGVLTHASGALTTVVFSFDTIATRSPNLEVHGDDASMVVPDPNFFDGTPLLHRRGTTRWEELAPTAGYREAGRGTGVRDLVATAPGRPRADAGLALHVLEVMEAMLAPNGSGPITSAPDRPAALPLLP
ncbi:Gfo/Idh/MocA family protein [Salsipaludibacter albus]|uniref:Gfo/Idh/MocA family protein n=1 Tax=Salsipaludibacter albus TaxID=2849650 RepID=UPI001EE4310D|nr:Gfo/Idh/MocA family oxidoreductase [Salsipaludibacter albus]MBY5162570.1 Gfo/Idh/MocA family oxidoreductase [Salsipaludibacter albus]